MQYFHDELMNHMIVARQQRVAELVAASQRGSRAGNAVRRQLGLSLIWLGERLRQDGRPRPPELVNQGHLRTRSGLT